MSRFFRTFSITAALLTCTVPALAAAVKIDAAIWADGKLFGTVATPTSFKVHPDHSLDLIYSFSMSGLQGQRSVAESRPGDRDFNGGRWWVQMAVFTPQGIAALDQDGDGVIDHELTGDAEVLEQVSLGNLEVFATETFFECPLLGGGR